MSIKINGTAFEVTPLIADPAMDDLYDVLSADRPPDTPVYRWSCKLGKGTDADGVIVMQVDCVVHVKVAEPGRKGKLPTISKKKSDALKKRVRKLLTLKTPEMREAVRKAIGPVEVTMDVRKMVRDYGELFSFDVHLHMMPSYYVLRPKGGPKDVYIVVGIPHFLFFSAHNIVPCHKAQPGNRFPYAWYGDVTENPQHTAWENEGLRHSEAHDNRWKTRWEERHRLRGIKSKPKKD